MTTLKDSTPNTVWINRVEDAWQSILTEVLNRGYHGTASVELLITDGTIQRITRSVQHVEKYRHT